MSSITSSSRFPNTHPIMRSRSSSPSTGSVFVSASLLLAGKLQQFRQVQPAPQLCLSHLHPHCIVVHADLLQLHPFLRSDTLCLTSIMFSLLSQSIHNSLSSTIHPLPCIAFITITFWVACCHVGYPAGSFPMAFQCFIRWQHVLLILYLSPNPISDVLKPEDMLVVVTLSFFAE